ncbi:hypothetical protein D9M71_551700 [compost metagenome]
MQLPAQAGVVARTPAIALDQGLELLASRSPFPGAAGEQRLQVRVLGGPGEILEPPLLVVAGHEQLVELADGLVQGWHVGFSNRRVFPGLPLNRPAVALENSI